jgi:hypothetical protein
MATLNKAEFWKELDATDEEFVRDKFAVSGYSSTKLKLVAEWLKRKDEQKRKAHEAITLNVAIRSVWWTQVGAIATSCAAIFGLIAIFWPK